MTLPLVGWFALILPLANTPGVPVNDRVETITKTGKVVDLSTVLKSMGLSFDVEPVMRQVILQEPDGTITPLLSNEASRALFLDERLRNRPAEIVARRHPGLPYLELVSFRVEEEGRFRIPEYYCEVCTISDRYPQESCSCCQGPMVLRMRPESR